MFTTEYTHSRERSLNFATENTEDSLTQQSDAKECDINIIMSRYQQTGQLPAQTIEAMSGDFSNIPDYRAMVETLQHANETFASLPAKVRKEFDNDPAQFVGFVKNPENLEKMREMGLANPKPGKTATLDDVVTAIAALKPQENRNGNP